jgi:hypothetical protein
MFSPGGVAEGESLRNAGVAVHVETAEKHGRGSGEGVLALSDSWLFFHFDVKPTPTRAFLGFSLREIAEVETNWIVAPGMRQLTMTLERDGRFIKTRFYGGKWFVNQVAAQIRR